MILLATLISTVVGLTAVATGVHCASQNGLRRRHSINPENYPKQVVYHTQFSNDNLKKFKKIVKHRAIPYSIAIKIIEIALTEITDLYTILKLIEMSEFKGTGRRARKLRMPEQFLQLLDKVDFSLTLSFGGNESRRRCVVVFKKYRFQYVSTKQIHIILNYKKLRNDRIPTIIFSANCLPYERNRTVEYVNLDAIIGLYDSATHLQMTLSEYGTYLYHCNNIHPAVTSLTLDFYQKSIHSGFFNRWTFDEKVESLDAYKFEDAFYLKHLTLVVGSLFTTEVFERMQYALDHLVQLEKLTMNYTNLCSVALSDLVSKKMNKLITDHLHIDIQFACIEVPEDHLTPSLLSRDTDYGYPEECETLHSKFESLIVQLEIADSSFGYQFSALKQLTIAVFRGNTSKLIILPYMPSVIKLEILGGFSTTRKMEQFGVKVIVKEKNPVALNISQLVNLTHIRLSDVIVDVGTVNSAPSTVTHLSVTKTEFTGGAVQVPENLKFFKLYDCLATLITTTNEYKPHLKMLFLYDINEMKEQILEIIRGLSNVIKEVIIRQDADFPDYIRISYLPSSSSVAGPGRQNYFFIVDTCEMLQSNCYSGYFKKSFELNIYRTPLRFGNYSDTIVNVCRSFLIVLSPSRKFQIRLGQSEIRKPTKYTIDHRFRAVLRYVYSSLSFEFTMIDTKLVFPLFNEGPSAEKLSATKFILR